MSMNRCRSIFPFLEVSFLLITITLLDNATCDGGPAVTCVVATDLNGLTAPRSSGWLGADVATSFRVDDTHDTKSATYLWLFQDTILGTLLNDPATGKEERHIDTLLSGSVAVQSIPFIAAPENALSSAALEFRWRNSDVPDATPAPMFQPADGELAAGVSYRTTAGIRVDRSIYIFAHRRSSNGVLGTTLITVPVKGHDNLKFDKYTTTDLPTTNQDLTWNTAVVHIPSTPQLPKGHADQSDYLYMFGELRKKTTVVSRISSVDLANGDWTKQEFWVAEAINNFNPDWKTAAAVTSSAPLDSVLADIGVYLGSESSVTYDTHLASWIALRIDSTDGSVKLAQASSLSGLWKDAGNIYSTPTSGYQCYAPKLHPQHNNLTRSDNGPRQPKRDPDAMLPLGPSMSVNMFFTYSCTTPQGSLTKAPEDMNVYTPQMVKCTYTGPAVVQPTPAPSQSVAAATTEPPKLLVSTIIFGVAIGTIMMAILIVGVIRQRNRKLAFYARITQYDSRPPAPREFRPNAFSSDSLTLSTDSGIMSDDVEYGTNSSFNSSFTTPYSEGPDSLDSVYGRQFRRQSNKRRVSKWTFFPFCCDDDVLQRQQPQQQQEADYVKHPVPVSTVTSNIHTSLIAWDEINKMDMAAAFPTTPQITTETSTGSSSSSSIKRASSGVSSSFSDPDAAAAVLSGSVPKNEGVFHTPSPPTVPIKLNSFGKSGSSHRSRSNTPAKASAYLAGSTPPTPIQFKTTKIVLPGNESDETEAVLAAQAQLSQEVDIVATAQFHAGSDTDEDDDSMYGTGGGGWGENPKSKLLSTVVFYRSAPQPHRIRAIRVEEYPTGKPQPQQQQQQQSKLAQNAARRNHASSAAAGGPNQHVVYASAASSRRHHSTAHYSLPATASSESSDDYNTLLS